MSSTEVELWREPDEGPRDDVVDYAAERARRAAELAFDDEHDDEPDEHDEVDDGARVVVRPPVGELVLYAPVRFIGAVERHSLRTLAGAIALVRQDWLSWVRHHEHAARLDHADTIAGAAGKNLNLGHRKDHHERTDKRMRRSAQVATLVLLGVFVLCVAGYSWWPWAPLAGGVSVLLFGVGLFSSDRSRAEWCRRLVLAPLPALLPLGITDLRWWPAAVFGGLLLALAWWRGGRVFAPEEPTPDGGPAMPRRDWQTLWATAHRVLAARGKVVERTGDSRPISGDGEENGVGIGARCTEPLLPEDVRALERELGFPVGVSSWVGDPRSAGSGELRLLWADPLPVRTLPRREPMSLSYTQSFVIAHRTGGRVTSISVNRTRILLAGNSGSGKSQGLQGFIDAVCDMPDAKWSGIDRQEGPTFKAYQNQWNCTGVYYSREDAIGEIRRLRALCLERNRRLDEGMDADLDGEVDQWWIVDETGEDEDRYGHVLFIDELSSATTDREFAAELTLLLEVCRKGSVSVVMATPDLDANRVPRAVLDQVNTTCGFACPFPDAVQMFGKGSTQAGWEPYSLLPATDDEPNDAGKAFIRGGVYNLPEIHRFGAMGKSEIVARNRARRQWREKHLGEVAAHTQRPGPDEVIVDRVDEVVDDADGIVDAEIVDEADVVLDEALRTALRLCGDREGLPVAESSHGLSREADRALRAAVPPRSIYLASAGKPVRSFARKDLVTALQRA